MGVFTQIDVHIEFETKEDSDKAFEVMENFREQIKEHIYRDREFHVNDLEADGDDNYIEVRINSSREPNARFHVDCLIKLFQIHKINVSTFNADIIQPDTYLSFDGVEDFNEYEINFE